ncbi:hypothetical protein B0H16DRAFT_1473888, partial [Mycena metata]
KEKEEKRERKKEGSKEEDPKQQGGAKEERRGKKEKRVEKSTNDTKGAKQKNMSMQSRRRRSRFYPASRARSICARSARKGGAVGACMSLAMGRNRRDWWQWKVGICDWRLCVWIGWCQSALALGLGIKEQTVYPYTPRIDRWHPNPLEFLLPRFYAPRVSPTSRSQTHARMQGVHTHLLAWSLQQKRMGRPASPSLKARWLEKARRVTITC